MRLSFHATRSYPALSCLQRKQEFRVRGKTSKEGCQQCFREVSFKAASINPSQAFSQGSRAQLSHKCVAAGFPLGHWDQTSSTSGIPQRTITQQVAASVLYTVTWSTEVDTTRAPFLKESSYVHAELNLPRAEILYNTWTGSCQKANASWQRGRAPSEAIPRARSLQQSFCSLFWRGWKTRGFPLGVR